MGPYIFVGRHRMLKNSDAGLHKFHCIVYSYPLTIQNRCILIYSLSATGRLRYLSTPNLKAQVSTREQNLKI